MSTFSELNEPVSKRRKLVEVQNQSQPESQAQINHTQQQILECGECEIGSSEEVVALCVDCGDLPLCLCHLQGHNKSRRTAQHKTKNINNRVEQSTSSSEEKLNGSLEASSGSTTAPTTSTENGLSQCTLHPREVLDCFCTSCESLVCLRCLLFSHKQHDYVDLATAESKYRNMAKEQIKQVEEALKDIEDEINTAQATAERLQKRSAEVQLQVEAKFDDLLQSVKENRQQVVEEAQRLKEQKQQRLDEQLAQLQQLADTLHTSDDQLQKQIDGDTSSMLMARSRMSQLLSTYEQLMNEIDLALQVEGDKFQVRVNKQLKEQIESSGELEDQTGRQAYGPYSQVSGRGVQGPVYCRLNNRFIVKTFNRRREALEEGGAQVRALIEQVDESERIEAQVVDLEDGNYEITYQPQTAGIHRLLVLVNGLGVSGSPISVSVSAMAKADYLTINGCKRTVIESNAMIGARLSYPYDIAVAQSGDIIVSDHSNRVLLFSSEGQFIRMICEGSGMADGRFEEVRSVDVNSRQEVLVIDQRHDRVQVFSIDGSFRRKFSIQTGESDLSRFGNDAYGLAVDHSDRVIVSDCYNHCIKIFSAEGQLLHQFGGRGTEDGKFIRPQSVAVDSKGRIIVTEYENSRVQVFDANGNFLFRFGTKGEGNGQFSGKNWLHLCVDMYDRIAISDYHNNRVQFFEEDGRYISRLEIPRPAGLAADKSGRVIVTQYNNEKFIIFTPLLM